MRFKLRMGVSGRHCHLKREDMDILFGKGSELHPIKPIVQPGQFTCEEKIILVTDKGEMANRACQNGCPSAWAEPADLLLRLS